MKEEDLKEKFDKTEFDYEFSPYEEKNEGNETVNKENIKQNKRFEVDSLSKADWCFKQIKKFENQKEKILKFASEEKEKYDVFAKKEIESIDKTIEHFKILIQMYVDREIKKDPKFKLKTPNGSASYGKLQKKLEFNDEEIFKYCKENNLDEFIKIETKEKLDKTKFKDYLQITEDNRVITADGEIMENVFVNEFSNFNLKTSEQQNEKKEEEKI